MVASQDTGEKDEKKKEDHEGHPEGLDVVLHGFILVSLPRQRVSILCDPKEDHLAPSLEEQKQPELPVIELAHAAANPKAMMVELPHALAAVVAVSAAIGLLYVTDVAETLRW